MRRPRRPIAWTGACCRSSTQLIARGARRSAPIGHGTMGAPNMCGQATTSSAATKQRGVRRDAGVASSFARTGARRIGWMTTREQAMSSGHRRGHQRARRPSHRRECPRRGHHPRAFPAGSPMKQMCSPRQFPRERRPRRPRHRHRRRSRRRQHQHHRQHRRRRRRPRRYSAPRASLGRSTRARATRARAVATQPAQASESRASDARRASSRCFPAATIAANAQQAPPRRTQLPSSAPSARRASSVVAWAVARAAPAGPGASVRWWART